MEHNIDRLVWGAAAVAIFAILYAIMKSAFPSTLNNIISYFNSLIPG